jgi:hypothetical protein
MGLDIYPKAIVGIKTSSIVKYSKESKDIPILDEWTQQPTGRTKKVSKDFYIMNNNKYTIQEIKEFFSTYKIEFFDTGSESNLTDGFIGFEVEDTFKSIKENRQAEYLETVNFNKIEAKIDNLKLIFKTFNITEEPKLIFYNYYSC